MPIRFKSTNELIGGKGFLIRGEQISCDATSSLQLSPNFNSTSKHFQNLYSKQSGHANHEPSPSNQLPTYFMHRQDQYSQYPPQSDLRSNQSISNAPYLLSIETGPTIHSNTQPRNEMPQRDFPSAFVSQHDHHPLPLEQPRDAPTSGPINQTGDFFSCNQVINDPLFEITSPHYPYR